jgi:hypothetical protein
VRVFVCGVNGEVDVGGCGMVAFLVVFKGNGAGFVTYAEGNVALVPLLVVEDSLAWEGVVPYSEAEFLGEEGEAGEGLRVTHN